MSKGFWMEKNSAQVSDGGAVFDNTTRVGPKRSYQWFVDSAEPELLSSKKQEVRSVNNKLSSEMSYASVNPWESTSSLQSVPNQYVDRLFGTEMARPINLTERNLSSVGTNDLSGNRMGTNSQFGVQLPPVLSVEDQEISLGYAGNRKVSVNQVKDCDNYVVTYNRGDLPTDQAFRRENEMSFVPMGQMYNKEHDNMMLMSHSCNTDNAHIRSSISHHVRGDDNATSMADMYVKANADMISFGGFPDEKDIIPVGRPLGGYDQLYQTSVISETRCENELDAPNANATSNTNYAVKPRTDSASRNKPESGTSKKEAPNSFPTNVRSLLSTRMLDGISVKYISLAREELRGTIKGLGYLCGCQSCNYAKVLNAYEFERHAGCKTKHPNNHIYFENGKTIYQIVQELRSTPETLLFDTIQTIFGAPINQKSFQIWKESFQVATRELQRIYGKEQLNF